MSEFRQDLVSGDWIIIAPGRAKRPHDFLPKKKRRVPTPKSVCPFENLKASHNWPPIAMYPQGRTAFLRGDKDVAMPRNWRAAIIPNKFPAVSHDTPTCASFRRDGPYKKVNGVGHHELLVMRDHGKSFDAIAFRDVVVAFGMFQERFSVFAADPCIEYVATFFNWGPTAGASLFHPHFQILALPIIPPDIAHSLHGSKRYREAHRACVHCVMIAHEKHAPVRVIAENSKAIAIAPYASHDPFEMRIYPKKHLPYFERTTAADLKDVLLLLQLAVHKMRTNLQDPDFNFFIHTAPVKHRAAHRHYHWHVEVIPKISTLGGFELSTGVIINSVDPDIAAKMLRGKS